MSSFKISKWEFDCRRRGSSNVKHGRCSECERRALFRSWGKKGNRRPHSDERHNLCANCYRKLGDALRAAA